MIGNLQARVMANTVRFQPTTELLAVVAPVFEDVPDCVQIAPVVTFLETLEAPAAYTVLRLARESYVELESPFD